MYPPRFRLRALIATVLAGVLVASVLGYFYLLEIAHHTKSLYHTTLGTSEARKHQAQQFWGSVFNTITQCQPRAYHARVVAEEKGEKPEEVVRFNKDSPRWNDWSRLALEQNYDIDDDVVADFKRNHDNYLALFPTELPSATYNQGLTGIVIIGGGKYSWLAYMALKNLRNLGLTLPVEFVLPTSDDYHLEQHLCEAVLPALNAKCVLVLETFGPIVSKKWKFKLYQYKLLALVVLSFQNVLMLDSDNFVIANPDYLMSSELFRLRGLITWPDYWNRRISPKWYDIVGVEVNNNRRVRYGRFPLAAGPGDNVLDEEADSISFHEMDGAIPDMLTELGQLAINKRTHAKTLLLSLYYNVYGPGLYYRMMSQGQAGEGDKDTFVAAAHVVKDPYYQVYTGIKTLGYFDSKHAFHGVGMGQADPLEDYDLFRLFEPIKPTGDETWALKKFPEGDERTSKLFSADRKPKKLFALHCNFPKMDPVELTKPDDRYNKWENRLNYKFYGDLKIERPRKDGTWETIDFELDKYHIMEEALCKDNLTFPHMAEMEPGKACEFAQNQIKFVEKKIREREGK